MPTFHIQSQQRVRTRVYSRTHELRTEDFELPNDSWVVGQWKVLAAQSLIKVTNATDVDMYKKVLQMLTKHEETSSLMKRACELIGRTEIIRLFATTEELISNSNRSPTTKTRMSSVFRNIVLSIAPQQSFREDISRTSIMFQTKLTTRPKPRKLISDTKDLNAPNELRPPVDALPHNSAIELIEKTEARISHDLEKIRIACINELQNWEKLRRKLVSLGKQKFNEENIALATKSLRSHKSCQREVSDFRKTADSETILGLYQHLIREHELAKLSRPYNPLFWESQDRLKHVMAADNHYMLSQMHRIHYLPYRIVSNELVAAFVLLLTYTGWNSMSLINMTVNDIEISDREISLQGYKSKTDDHTPRVYLDSSHKHARQAINLLLWNRDQLIKLGFLNNDEEHLWFTWSTCYKALKHQYIGFQNALENLQKQHKLIKFSLEQIRAQVLAHESVKSRDPEYVRRVAGHNSLSTTGHYLNQILLRRLNQAISLEFQRRLENTVTFRLSKNEEAFASKTDKRYVDLGLLTPLGDGSSCTDPTAPPDKAFISGNLCDARQCHTNSGCKNRRIIIDYERLQELVRKRHYYLRNWQRLENENASAFEHFHIPAILFTLGLYDYILSGHYRHLLLKVESGVAEHENYS